MFSKSFRGLKLNVPRGLRLQLFLSSVKGPFLTSGVLGIFKKTLLPCRALNASSCYASVVLQEYKRAIYMYCMIL